MALILTPKPSVQVDILCIILHATLLAIRPSSTCWIPSQRQNPGRLGIHRSILEYAEIVRRFSPISRSLSFRVDFIELTPAVVSHEDLEMLCADSVTLAVFLLTLSFVKLVFNSEHSSASRLRSMAKQPGLLLCKVRLACGGMTHAQ